MKPTVGCVLSTIDGTEKIFGISMPEGVPSEYSYESVLPDIINQGEYSICVPCSISAFLNWKENLKDGSRKDNGIKYFDIYNSKSTKGEGMTFKDAFSYLRHHGVASKSGLLKVGAYAMVTSSLQLQYAIIANGPCVGALPVYSGDDDFWNKKQGDRFLGYHAISIMGYDNDGFIIRNSWGEEFGKDGYTHLDFEDFGKFLEIWTVIE